MGSVRKRVEIWGRRLFIRVVALILRRTNHERIGDAGRILVVRVDRRLGNAIMTLPLLNSLRDRFPQARIDLLAHSSLRKLLQNHSAIDDFLSYDKWKLFKRTGPVRTLLHVRRRSYDLAIDAGNATDPSTTNALLTCLSAARRTLGIAQRSWASLYTNPVELQSSDHGHEITLRLAVLRGINECNPVMGTRLAAPSPPPSIRRLLDENNYTTWGVLNVGARTNDKRLDVPAYLGLVDVITQYSRLIITYGPSESELAVDLHSQSRGRLVLAPATDLPALASLMAEASFVVSCDTGPMHLAVAVGTPTFGVFVRTDRARFGYNEPPHRCRSFDDPALSKDLRTWLRFVLPGEAIAPTRSVG